MQETASSEMLVHTYQITCKQRAVSITDSHISPCSAFHKS